MGDGAIAGDKRWSGSFGVNVDYVARSNGSVEIIPLAGLQVSVGVSCMPNMRVVEGGWADGREIGRVAACEMEEVIVHTNPRGEDAPTALSLQLSKPRFVLTAGLILTVRPLFRFAANKFDI